jgi:hypothetical protein
MRSPMLDALPARIPRTHGCDQRKMSDQLRPGTIPRPTQAQGIAAEGGRFILLAGRFKMSS